VVLRALFICLLLAFASASAITGVPAIKPGLTDSRPGYSSTEHQILALVNHERVVRELGILIWDDQLAKVARDYSIQMARQGFFDHMDPSGFSVEDRAYRANLRSWRKIGENLFYVADLDDYSQLAVRMWMQSSSHRRNVLDRTWTSTGIGIAKSANGRTYVTQVFLAD
jgi:uncharacterized protein YkwD